MWFLFAILSAFFWVVQATLIKRLKDRIPPKLIVWGMIMFEWPFVFPFILYEGIPLVREGFFIGLLISLLINIFAVTLYIKALHLSPLSISFPLLSFTPLFITLTGFIILKEFPSYWGIAGIILIVTGAYILESKEKEGGIFSPLKSLFKEKGAGLMFLVSFLWAISACADKLAVINSSTYFYIVIFGMIFSSVYFHLAKKESNNFKKEVFLNIKYLIALGFLGALMMIFQFFSISIAQASYVIAVKRSGMLFAIPFGLIFFNEKVRIRKIAGSILMAGGLICLAMCEK